MWVTYILLFFVLYITHCLMARNLLSYYTVKHYPFHLNLIRWNQDVQLLLESVVP